MTQINRETISNYFDNLRRSEGIDFIKETSLPILGACAVFHGASGIIEPETFTQAETIIGSYLTSAVFATVGILNGVEEAYEETFGNDALEPYTSEAALYSAAYETSDADFSAEEIAVLQAAAVEP